MLTPCGSSTSFTSLVESTGSLPLPGMETSSPAEPVETTTGILIDEPLISSERDVSRDEL